MTEAERTEQGELGTDGPAEAVRRVGLAPTASEMDHPERSSRNTSAGAGSKYGGDSVQPAADDGTGSAQSIQLRNEGAL